VGDHLSTDLNYCLVHQVKVCVGSSELDLKIGHIKMGLEEEFIMYLLNSIPDISKDSAVCLS
jgi:hypothetical protein